MDKQNILLMATILCLLICNSSPVAATNGDEYLPSYGGPEEPKGIEPVQILVRLVFSLIIVVALFYISARFLKSRWANSRTAEHMAILDRLSLGPNQNIFIIRLGKDYLVLGVTGDNISLLQRIEDGDLLARLEIEALRHLVWKPLLTQIDIIGIPLISPTLCLCHESILVSLAISIKS